MNHYSMLDSARLMTCQTQPLAPQKNDFKPSTS